MCMAVLLKVVATLPNQNKGGKYMAYDIALNRNTHDLVVHNDLLLIDNLERVVQQVKITLLEL